MDVAGKVIAITGGASGIGRAMAVRFHEAGAKHIAIADRNEAGAAETAHMVGGSYLRVDVAHEPDIQKLVADTERGAGPIDLMVSNAGVIDTDPDFDNAASSPDAAWNKLWGIHVMAHVYAARAVLPGMIARRSGHILNTVSAAGLLSQIGSAVYSTTKHAAIGFAESLAIAHKDHGIIVQVLCPQGVDTPLVPGTFFSGADVDGVLTAEQVAETTLQGLINGGFLILPHPNVANYIKLKAENYDRWLGGMTKLRRRVAAARAAQWVSSNDSHPLKGS